MNNTTVEIKSIAKAVTASLKRQGHPTPHSAVLHALASALNKRNWHVLKASATQELAPSGSSSLLLDTLETLKTLSAQSLFWLRLAYLEGKLPADCLKEPTLAHDVARRVCGTQFYGVLKWGGWSLPAILDLTDSSIDAGDFEPKLTGKQSTPGTLALTLGKGRIEFEVFFQKGTGWSVSKAGVLEFYDQLEKMVSLETLGVEIDKLQAPALEGPEVPVRFYTDCRTFEIKFDARAYLQQAGEEVLRAIMSVGYGGDYCTDNVAEYMADHGLNEELQEAFDFLRAVNRRASKDPTGFECQLDGQAYLTWVKACRPQVLALYLCGRYDIDLMQAQEEEIHGMWDWVGPEGNACDHSFDTLEEAALDACEKLNLFEQEMEACDACW